MALCHGGRNQNSRSCEPAARLPGQGALTQLTAGGACRGLGRCPVLDQGVASFSSEGGDKGWAFTGWDGVASCRCLNLHNLRTGVDPGPERIKRSFCDCHSYRLSRRGEKSIISSKGCDRQFLLNIASKKLEPILCTELMVPSTAPLRD